jgi:hypothetical protein
MNDIELEDNDFSEFSFGYGYARGIGKNAAIGGSIHYLRVSTNIDDISANGFKIDLGFLWLLPYNAKIGMMLRNPISLVSFSTGTDDHLPIQGVIGLSLDIQKRVLFAVDLHGSEEDLTKRVAVGLEIDCYRDMLYLRSGAYKTYTEPRRIAPSAGIGVRYQNMIVDYSFELDEDVLGNTHRFSVSMLY